MPQMQVNTFSMITKKSINTFHPQIEDYPKLQFLVRTKEF